MSSLKGIFSPWVAKPTSDPVRVLSKETADDLTAFDEARQLHVTMDGQVCKLHLPYLLAEGRDKFKDAATEFGEVLNLLWKIKGTVALFEEQSLHRTKPLGPKIVLTFGPCIVYAKASSREPELAKKMAIDRLCTALRSARARMPEAKKLLDGAGVKVSVK